MKFNLFILSIGIVNGVEHSATHIQNLTCEGLETTTASKISAQIKGIPLYYTCRVHQFITHAPPLLSPSTLLPGASFAGLEKRNKDVFMIVRLILASSR